MEPVQPVQMNIHQSNSYRKDFNWLHFDDEPRVLREATSEGPIHTIGRYVIIFDEINFLKISTKRIRFLLDF